MEKIGKGMKRGKFDSKRRQKGAKAGLGGAACSVNARENQAGFLCWSLSRRDRRCPRVVTDRLHVRRVLQERAGRWEREQRVSYPQRTLSRISGFKTRPATRILPWGCAGGGQKTSRFGLDVFTVFFWIFAIFSKHFLLTPIGGYIANRPSREKVRFL